MSFRHGLAERVYRMEFVSNQDFTDSEFTKWKDTLEKANLLLPTKPEVERKAKDIAEALRFRPKEDDIDHVSSTWNWCHSSCRAYSCVGIILYSIMFIPSVFQFLYMLFIAIIDCLGEVAIQEKPGELCSQKDVTDEAKG